MQLWTFTIQPPGLATADAWLCWENHLWVHMMCCGVYMYICTGVYVCVCVYPGPLICRYP